MQNAPWLACAFVLVSGCANACGSQERSHATGSGTTSATAERDTPAKPATPPMSTAPAQPRLPIVAWELFKPLAPDALDDFHAVGDATGREYQLAGDARLSTLSRKYDKGETKLELEMHDAVQTPNMLTMFEHARTLQRETPEAVMRAVTVQSHDALAQWNKSTQTARVSVLVEKRFVINLAVKPATSPDAAIALAGKLDYASIAKLGPAP